MKRLFIAWCVLMLVSCEKLLVPDTSSAKGIEDDANVTLTFMPYKTDFTRAASPLSDQMGRLSAAIFKTDGTKVKSVTQKHDDAGFGGISVSLAAGTYKVVAIAHNGDGTATITSAEKVTFANNKVTDTFAYYGTLEVDEEPVDKELQMQRCVAMVRLTVNDNIPAEVQRLKFYYTGGSSTYNPTTGYGCVNSKQTEYRYTHNDDGIGVNQYDIYTMPHELNDELKIVISALDSDGGTLYEWTMDNVPVTRNKITTWTGSLFGDGPGGAITQGGITLTLDTAWDGTLKYNW